MAPVTGSTCMSSPVVARASSSAW